MKTKIKKLLKEALVRCKKNIGRKRKYIKLAGDLYNVILMMWCYYLITDDEYYEYVKMINKFEDDIFNIGK